MGPWTTSSAPTSKCSSPVQEMQSPLLSSAPMWTTVTNTEVEDLILPCAALQVIEDRSSPIWPEFDLKIDTKILPEVAEIPPQEPQNIEIIVVDDGDDVIPSKRPQRSAKRLDCLKSKRSQKKKEKRKSCHEKSDEKPAESVPVVETPPPLPPNPASLVKPCSVLLNRNDIIHYLELQKEKKTTTRLQSKQSNDIITILKPVATLPNPNKSTKPVITNCRESIDTKIEDPKTKLTNLGITSTMINTKSSNLVITDTKSDTTLNTNSNKTLTYINPEITCTMLDTKLKKENSTFTNLPSETDVLFINPDTTLTKLDTFCKSKLHTTITNPNVTCTVLNNKSDINSSTKSTDTKSTEIEEKHKTDSLNKKLKVNLQRLPNTFVENQKIIVPKEENSPDRLVLKIVKDGGTLKCLSPTGNIKNASPTVKLEQIDLTKLTPEKVDSIIPPENKEYAHKLKLLAEKHRITQNKIVKLEQKLSGNKKCKYEHNYAEKSYIKVTKVNRFLCPFCTKVYSRSYRLRNHIESCHGVKNVMRSEVTLINRYTCIKCNRSSFETLKSHICAKKSLKKHKESCKTNLLLPEEKLCYFCDICDLQFYSEIDLNNHKLQQHTRIKSEVIIKEEIIDDDYQEMVYEEVKMESVKREEIDETCESDIIMELENKILESKKTMDNPSYIQEEINTIPNLNILNEGIKNTSSSFKERLKKTVSQNIAKNKLSSNILNKNVTIDNTRFLPVFKNSKHGEKKSKINTIYSQNMLEKNKMGTSCMFDNSLQKSATSSVSLEERKGQESTISIYDFDSDGEGDSQSSMGSSYKSVVQEDGNSKEVPNSLSDLNCEIKKISTLGNILQKRVPTSYVSESNVQESRKNMAAMSIINRLNSNVIIAKSAIPLDKQASSLSSSLGEEKINEVAMSSLNSSVQIVRKNMISSVTERLKESNMQATSLNRSLKDEEKRMEKIARSYKNNSVAKRRSSVAIIKNAMRLQRNIKASSLNNKLGEVSEAVMSSLNYLKKKTNINVVPKQENKATTITSLREEIRSNNSSINTLNNIVQRNINTNITFKQENNATAVTNCMSEFEEHIIEETNDIGTEGFISKFEIDKQEVKKGKAGPSFMSEFEKFVSTKNTFVNLHEEPEELVDVVTIN